MTMENERNNKLNLLIKGRAKGKTVGLIYASEVTGYPIIAPNEESVRCIEEKAKELGVRIPDPISIRNWRWTPGAYKPECVLIDEVYSLIGKALDFYLGTHVVAATMTDYREEQSC